MIIKTLNGDAIDSDNPAITTHNGYTGEAKEIVFQIENDSTENKTYKISISGLLERNEYRLAKSNTLLSGAEWSLVEKDTPKEITLGAGESSTMRARIYIAGGSNTAIIDANINVEELTNV